MLKNAQKKKLQLELAIIHIYANGCFQLVLCCGTSTGTFISMVLYNVYPCPIGSVVVGSVWCVSLQLALSRTLFVTFGLCGNGGDTSHCYPLRPKKNKQKNPNDSD